MLQRARQAELLQLDLQACDVLMVDVHAFARETSQLLDCALQSMQLTFSSHMNGNQANSHYAMAVESSSSCKPRIQKLTSMGEGRPGPSLNGNDS